MMYFTMGHQKEEVYIGTIGTMLVLSLYYVTKLLTRGCCSSQVTQRCHILNYNIIFSSK